MTPQPPVRDLRHPRVRKHLGALLPASLFAALLLLALMMTALPAGVWALDPVFKADGDVAINGYDPVAYHTAGKATPGDPAIAHAWNGATWQFATAANRDLFAANPEQYAPQYGGYCAYAVSRNYTAKTDPDAWSLVEGKLYLNYSTGVKVLWSTAKSSNITKADANWPGLQSK